MTTPYRLYYAPDNASLIIRLALEEIGAPYETVLVDRAARGQSSPAYLALNPNGLIPVLETPQGPLFETAAILLCLGETHDALFPASKTPERGAALKWLFFTSNTLHAELRMLFYPAKYAGPDAAAQTALCTSLRHSLTAHLAKLDTLAGQGHAWFNGERISLLDLYIAVILRWMALYPVGGTGWFDLARTPRLHALAARMEQRAATQRAITAEGLGPTPFTAPRFATPPEGSAT